MDIQTLPLNMTVIPMLKQWYFATKIAGGELHTRSRTYHSPPVSEVVQCLTAMEAVTTVGITVSYLKQKKVDMSYTWNMHYYAQHSATNFGL